MSLNAVRARLRATTSSLNETATSAHRAMSAQIRVQSAIVSDEPQIGGRRPWEYLPDAVAIQAPQACEQTAEHRAVVVEHGIIAILHECRGLHAYLLPGNASPRDAAAEHPVHRAMPVIRAAIAVFAERASEFREHDDDRVVPFGSERARERVEATAQIVEIAGELAACAAFVDVRVPAADIDEPEAIFVAHEARDTRGLDGETARVDRAAARRLLRGILEFVGDLLAQFEAVGDGRVQVMVLVHAGENGVLALVERGFADGAQRDVRHVAGAAERERQRVRERDGCRARAKRGGKARHETRSVIALVRGFAALDAVLRLEVAAR